MTIDNLPLCVDLDGTLCPTDTLWEYFLAALKKNWAILFIAPLKLLKGKANFKSYLVRSIGTYAPKFMFQEDLLSYLKSEREKGRKLYLATGSHEIVANRAASQAGIFDGVFATNEHINLISQNKADLLHKTFPEGFVYAGNSHQDLKVWELSAAAILVNAPAAISSLARTKYKVIQEFGESPNQPSDLFKSVHPYRWIKNLLIFLPFLWSQNNSPWEFSRIAIGFASLCLCSASIYLTRDLIYIDTDRAMFKKNLIATGRLEISKACLITPILGCASVICALILGKPFFFLYIVYAFLVAISCVSISGQKNFVRFLILAATYLWIGILGWVLL